MALTKISTAGVKDDIVTSAKIADDAVIEALIGTNAVGQTQIGPNAVGESEIITDAVTLSKIADDAVDEARLQISNAGTNGQYLQKQSGNTGGLTWANVPAGVGGATGVDFNDGVLVRWGDNNEFTIDHGANTNTHIKHTGAGHIYMQSVNDIYFRNNTSQENYAKFINNGAVELYYDNAKKLETTAGGILATGDVDSTTGIFERTTGFTSQLKFNGSNETRLIHASNGQVKLAFYASGNAVRGYIDGQTGFFQIKTAFNESAVICRDNAAVELYYDNVKKLETTSAGVTVTGSLAATAGLNIDTSATSSTQALTLKAPNNNRISIWKNRDGGDGSWYTSGGGSEINLQWNSYSTGDVLYLRNNGQVGIGTSDPNSSEIDASARCLHVYKNATNGALLKCQSSNTTFQAGAFNNQAIVRTHTDDPLIFGTNGSERMRLDGAGHLILTQGYNSLENNYANLHINTYSDGGRGGIYIHCSNQSAGTAEPHYGIKIDAVGCANNASLQSGILIDLNQQYTQHGTGVKADVQGNYGLTKGIEVILNKTLNAYTDGMSFHSNISTTGAGGSAFHFRGQVAGTDKVRIALDGDIVNADNSYGSISDVKLKENIVDANSQWADIKAVKVRNFNFKTDPSRKLLGVVAQEIETISSGLVKTENDTTVNEDTGVGTVTGTTKTVKYSVLYMKAIKALQEAMAKIETLETKVAALEAK